MYENSDQWEYWWADGYWLVQLLKYGGGTIGKTYNGRWDYKAWLAGELVSDGNMDGGNKYMNHHEAARKIREGCLALLEDTGTAEAELLLDYHDWNFRHGPTFAVQDFDLICATCKGAFRSYPPPGQGFCPGSGALH